MAQPIKIACVGNSITYGAKIENREQNSYPAQLEAMLGEGYIVGNFGKNGATLLKKGNIPYTERVEYKDALAFNPDWVLIKLGTNDTKPINRIYLDEYFMDDYRDLIQSFRSLESKPSVVLLLPVPVFSDDSTGITSSVVEEKLIPMISQIAFETGCEIINLYDLMIDKPELLPDNVHPNASGARIIAHRLAEHIRMKSDDFDFTQSLSGDKQHFNYHGFKGHDFEFMGRKAKVVSPKRAALGHPWIWRGRYWGHEPQVEIALLERGWHVVYCDVYEMFGNEEALSIWDAFYNMLEKNGFADRSVMEGMSRGGLYIYRWASRYPDRIAAVYADAPLLDLKLYSKGREHGFPQKWNLFKEAFDLDTDEEALAFKGNPLDMASEIAQMGFPMLHVVGDADSVVPIAESTVPFEKEILENGGDIQVIHKPDVGHHPHSLENPQLIVDFIIQAMESVN